MGFIDLKIVYDKVTKEALSQVLRMYDVGGKLLNGNKSMYVNGLACVRIKGDERECFRIDWLGSRWCSKEKIKYIDEILFVILQF